MARYIARRILLMIPTLFAVSIIAFVIIQLPPGDYVSAYLAQLAERGESVSPETEEALRAQYALDRPIAVQYFSWLSNFVRGRLGRSWSYGVPVKELFAQRLPYSFLISFVSFLFVWALGLPIGVLSATKQYSVWDYLFTFIGFIGLAIPNFLFALVVLWIVFSTTGNVMIGLFSPEYMLAPMSFAKLWDLITHLWIPALIVGTASTAGLIRTVRANLLDELRKPYVLVARSKGLPESRVLFKYPFRIAMNPAVSTIGWVLPSLVSGELMTSIVLNTPTIAPVLVRSLLIQDMYAAGSIILVLGTLGVLGTLISDILLAWLDPRIREAV